MTPEAMAVYGELTGKPWMKMYEHLREPGRVGSHDDRNCAFTVLDTMDTAFGWVLGPMQPYADWSAYRLATGDYFRFCWMDQGQGCSAPCCTPLDNQ